VVPRYHYDVEHTSHIPLVVYEIENWEGCREERRDGQKEGRREVKWGTGEGRREREVREREVSAFEIYVTIL